MVAAQVYKWGGLGVGGGLHVPSAANPALEFLEQQEAFLLGGAPASVRSEVSFNDHCAISAHARFSLRIPHVFDIFLCGLPKLGAKCIWGVVRSRGLPTEHCDEFSFDEENKLVYTDLHNEYIDLVEEHVVSRLQVWEWLLAGFFLLRFGSPFYL